MSRRCVARRSTVIYSVLMKLIPSRIHTACSGFNIRPHFCFLFCVKILSRCWYIKRRHQLVATLQLSSCMQDAGSRKPSTSRWDSVCLGLSLSVFFSHRSCIKSQLSLIDFNETFTQRIEH